MAMMKTNSGDHLPSRMPWRLLFSGAGNVSPHTWFREIGGLPCIGAVIKAMNFLVNAHDLDGVFNLTAPGAVSNADFTRELGRAISRPTIFPLPGLVVKAVFGEMGDRLLLHGQNVVPARLLDLDFEFDFPSLDSALSDIFFQ